MEPSITDREAFKVAGVIRRIKRGTETPKLFARIWTAFESHRGEIATHSIGTTYQHIFGTWLPAGPFEVKGTSAPFEEYSEDMSKQPVRIHIPVTRRAERYEGG